jgi:uncharacterized protein involved in outer membrane biogenesis
MCPSDIMPFTLRNFGRASRIALVVLIVLAVAAALFDWDWTRHPLEQYLSKTSQREVRIGHLSLDFAWSLEPTAHLRDVRVENAPWADKRPFALVREAFITFSLQSVWEGRPVISRLVLIDADLDLERQADGLRNWRLRHPEDRGPGKVKVLRLEPHHTTIRFVRRDIGLDVTASANSVQSGAGDEEPEPVLPTRVQFKGEFRSARFSGDVQTGKTLSLLDTGENFRMRGHASVGKTRLEADGEMADLFHPSAIDAKVHLAGPSLSDLRGFFHGAPASRRYDLEAHVKQERSGILSAQGRGRVGHSDLAGEISFEHANERPTVRATLQSKSADLADLLSLVGGHLPAASVHATADTAAGTRARALPDHAFNSEHLKSLDAHVSLDCKACKAANFSLLESLRVIAELRDGILVLSPIEIGFAGGQVTGGVTLNAQHNPLSMHAKLDMKDVRLEKLLGGLKKGARSAGPLQGHADLKGHGENVAALVASVSGKAEIDMHSGGISNLLDAKLGLNGGKILRLMLTGDGAIGINSARASFDFDKGLGRSTTILLDTDQTHTQGTGIIDLHDQSVDVLLTPHPKKRGLLTLHKSIRVHGSIRDPKFTLAAKD